MQHIVTLYIYTRTLPMLWHYTPTYAYTKVVSSLQVSWQELCMCSRTWL